MPYLYSAMVSAHEAHIPVLAPIFAAFEDDPACFADADAAMFGPCLLAAPALRDGAREVEVYLPRGPESWRDFWTGRVYAAGQIATIPAPLDQLPLLAPAGAIVAMTDNGDDYSRLHDEPSRGLCHIAVRRVAKIRASRNDQTAATAVRHVSIRPWHVWTLLAREPGDLWIGHRPCWVTWSAAGR
jgi:alpha-glucosidase (family GH31 glycosyl hydrolase)